MFIALMATAYAEVPPQLKTQKEKDIYKLLEVTKVEESARLLVDQTLLYVKEQKKNVPSAYWGKLAQKIDLKKYLLKLVPIYDRYYTHEEIKSLIAFFQTPIGKKYIDDLPKINTEIYEVGNEFGKEVGRIIKQSLKEDGY